MNENTPIESKLVTKATARLEKEVAEELKLPDPPEKTMAELLEEVEDEDTNEQQSSDWSRYILSST